MKKYAGVILLIVLSLGSFAGIAAAQDLSVEAAADKVKSIVNEHFVKSKDAVIEGVPVEEHGLYKVSMSVNKSTQSFYLTKDGSLLLFPNGYIDIAQFEKNAKSRLEPVKEDIPKKKKPEVELFVMSLCPYGLRAEKEILPVIRSFGDTVDFKIKFIVHVKGGLISDVVSLHGIDEVKEDLRQAAIMAYYPDKFAAYLQKIDEKSCVISCGEIKLEDYWKKTAKDAGMDVKKIESFVYGQEGITLLKQNEADGAQYGIAASPTLVINGVVIRAVQQGPDALKQAICAAFTKSPGMCKRNNP